MDTPTDARQYAPATQRNREAILAVLSRVLPPNGNILEISSGTGEHAIFFAPHLSPRHWYPSDPNPLALASINAWREHYPCDRLHPPLQIDTRDRVWSIEKQKITINAIVNINMIHIAPWSACLGLMAGANRLLKQGGILYLYGPFQQEGKHTAPSNYAFDESLRAQNPEWGVRHLEEVIETGRKNNLKLLEVVSMPANNLSLIFQRQEGEQ
jgi:hypothetical protein